MGAAESGVAHGGRCAPGELSVSYARIRRMTVNRPTTEPIVGPRRSLEMRSTRSGALVG
jgi:hypothetical protein